MTNMRYAHTHPSPQADGSADIIHAMESMGPLVRENWSSRDFCPGKFIVFADLVGHCIRCQFLDAMCPLM